MPLKCMGFELYPAKINQPLEEQKSFCKARYPATFPALNHPALNHPALNHLAMSKTSTPLRRSLPCETEDLNHLMQALLQVRREMLRLEAACPHALEKVLPAHIKSARNLVHYLAMRSQDIRDLQGNLAEWGLSSLGRSERKVQAAVDTVLHVMHRLLGKDWAPEEKPPACFREGRLQLEKNTAALLGEHPDGRRVRIMVTLRWFGTYWSTV